MVRVGIIGFGFMGQMHWRCYEKMRDKVSVVAVADTDARRATGHIDGTWGNLGDGLAQVDFRGVTTTTNWRELVSLGQLDVVDVCVPTPYHVEIVEAALAEGKHVLCEKPLARSSDDAKNIGRLRAHVNSFVMPAMCMRFWPEWAWLKQAVAENRYGRVLSAHFLRQGTIPPGWYRNGQMSGGALLDLHIHDTDFVCYLFGKPKAVSSRGYRATSGHIDHVSTQYHYDEIPLVVAEGGWAFAESYPFRMRYTVNFENSTTADFELGRAQPLIVYQEKRALAIECEAVDGWFKQIQYFVGCVSSQQAPEVVTVEDAILALQIAEAEERSIDQNGIEIISS